jgi:hypothetical protein
MYRGDAGLSGMLRVTYSWSWNESFEIQCPGWVLMFPVELVALGTSFPSLLVPVA